MNLIKISFLLTLALGLISFRGIAQEIETKKSLTKFDFSTVDNYRDSKFKGQIINDYGGLLTPMQKQEISDILYDYNLKTTRQIVIVTVDTIKPYSDIQKFATDLANYWGVGTSEKNNGLTMVICNSCRQIGIATGTGTELILTNEICKEVIEKIIIPEFKDGKYYNGIKNGIEELIKTWE